LYKPFKAGLEFFYAGSPSWAEAEKAMDEFFADKPEKILLHIALR
jgi:hypothetical protein